MKDFDKVPLNDKENSKEQSDGISQQPGENFLNKSTHHSQTKTQFWSFQGMEVDNPEPSTKAVQVREEDYQEPQIMDEDLENLDIGELDILGLEHMKYICIILFPLLP